MRISYHFLTDLPITRRARETEIEVTRSSRVPHGYECASKQRLCDVRSYKLFSFVNPVVSFAREASVSSSWGDIVDGKTKTPLKNIL